MRAAGRDEQVFDRPRVIAEHTAIADAESIPFQDDDAAGRQGLGGFLDRLTAAGDGEVGAPRGQLLDEVIDP